MARRRVLALSPAVSRMMCMTNPYQQVRRRSTEDDDAPPRRRPWLLWRRKKKEGASGRRRRTWGLRVGRLRIRALSPLKLLKRLCAAYMKILFASGNKMDGAREPSFSHVSPMPLPGLMGTTFVG